MEEMKTSLEQQQQPDCDSAAALLEPFQDAPLLVRQTHARDDKTDTHTQFMSTVMCFLLLCSLCIFEGARLKY